MVFIMSKKKEKMDIKLHESDLSVPDYVIKLSGLRSALSDFYVKSGNVCILGLFDETNTGKGFCLTRPGKTVELLLLAVENDDPILKKELLIRLMHRLSAGTELSWRILDHPEDEKLAASCGFRPMAALNIFRTVGADDGRADEAIVKFRPLYESMEKRGYRTVCFEDLTEYELRQILENPDGEFDDSLCPEAIINNPAGGFSARMSFASVKNGKVSAYSVIRCPDAHSCVFEIICVAASERGRGQFVLPFYRSLREMKDAGVRAVCFAVYEENSRMLELARKKLSRVVVSKTVQHNMNVRIGTGFSSRR